MMNCSYLVRFFRQIRKSFQKEIFSEKLWPSRGVVHFVQVVITSVNQLGLMKTVLNLGSLRNFITPTKYEKKVFEKLS